MLQDTGCDRSVKFILVGDSGVGKTALVEAFCENKFHEFHVSTVGVDFKTKYLVHNNKLVQLNIWDTAGQERFRSLITSFYKNAAVVFLVFDASDKFLPDDLDGWLDEINSHCPPDRHIILIGNKCDKISDMGINHDHIKQFSAERNLNYIEVSAKTRKNVTQMFTGIIDELSVAKVNAPRQRFGGAADTTSGRPRRTIMLLPQIRNNSCCA